MGLIANMLQSPYSGIPCILMPPEAFIQKPVRWLQAISRYRATTSGAPNFAYELCIQKITSEERKNLDLSSWEVAFSGAEPIRAETLERFTTTFESCGFRAQSFYPCYGMAETTVFVSGGLKTALPVVCQVDEAALEQNRVVVVEKEQKNVRKIVGCGGRKIFIARFVNASSCRLLHKSEKGEAFAPEFIGKIRVFIRKCFAPTVKNRMRARDLLVDFKQRTTD